MSNRSSRVSSLIVDDAIFQSPGWSARLVEAENGFVLLRFRGGLQDLLRLSARFDGTIAIVEKSLFEQGDEPEQGIPPRARRTLRPIARIDGTEAAPELERLLLLGCCGFIRDNISKSSLGRILRAVAAGNIAVPRKILSGALQRAVIGSAAPKLTTREQEILRLLGQRMSNRRIAETLFISEQTLRWHIRNVYSKTEASSRAELVEYARAEVGGLETEEPASFDGDSDLKTLTARASGL